MTGVPQLKAYPLHPSLLPYKVSCGERECDKGQGVGWGRHIGLAFKRFGLWFILAPLEPFHFWASLSSSVKWGCLSAPTSFVEKDKVTWGWGAQVHSQESWALVLALPLLSWVTLQSHSTFLGLFPYLQNQGLAELNCFITYFLKNKILSQP